MKSLLVSTINKFPSFKKNILRTKDFWDKYWALTAGNVIRIPALLRNFSNSKVIAKPGTLNMGAVFNPGAITENDKIILLANGQKIPWYKARGKNRDFYVEGGPLLFFLNRINLDIEEQRKIKQTKGFPTNLDIAVEDMRLFNWGNKIMVNHSLIIKGKKEGFVNQNSVKSALSVLDIQNNTLNFCTTPKLDFLVQNFEKNWIYSENDEKLLLFYSINPYRVLVLDNEKDFSFKTIVNQENNRQLKDPGKFGTMVSFSTNPIDYDDSHLLIIIHQIKHKFTGRCYFHWAMLVDKSNLLPVKITSQPIFSGMGARGRLPGIRYISSVTRIDDEFLFFAGEGDIYATVIKKKMNELEKLFIEI